MSTFCPRFFNGADKFFLQYKLNRFTKILFYVKIEKENLREIKSNAKKHT